MNWGTGITLFFVFFAVGMISLVVATTRHPPQLMQKDYYSLDLNYQERLDKKKNAANLVALPQVRFDVSSAAIQVQLPSGMIARQGTAKCYRSVTTHDDVLVKFESASTLHIPAERFPAGRWHIELDWETDDGRKYFWETTLVK